MDKGSWDTLTSRIKKWSKIFMPYKFLRYYPPQFVLRNPVLEGVYSAVSQGMQVAVIVFNLSNTKELQQQLESTQAAAFKEDFKKSFREALEGSAYREDVLVVHDHSSDGLILFLKNNEHKQNVVYIETFIKDISPAIKKGISKLYPYFDLDFDIGYMFIEKQHYSTQDAIFKAQQQAIAMAQKRVQSQYIEMVLEMRNIIHKRHLSLLAQPIVDLAENQVKGWEFLARGPENTPYEYPLQLFSVARQTNMVYDLELLVLEKAFLMIGESQCKEDIFINFTPLTLGNKRFVAALEKMLLEYPYIKPQQIIFEITERDSIEGLKFFHENIGSLRLKGFRFAVDDTGAGYASLHTISEIMPDIIKIDRSVIQDIDTNSVKESMLKGLLLIAKETGSLVVAEGIEKKEEAEVLSRNRVDLAQGYLYAKPGKLLLDRVAL
ncbi:EAL domain-containing protein [Bacillus lacus]|uniref:EAL domain-containing protein n=1 Tax=Metabacillus lacus TaxID=1983721 RepID=A0A7X2J225_9BACI|nr:EAL domain-containing protein [Metabacillus lacus]MRX73228.1 EAL domain-containing protein [Metabacillus lacus]